MLTAKNDGVAMPLQLTILPANTPGFVYASRHYKTRDSMSKDPERSISRRRLLTMIGWSAGSSAMYQAMHSLGFAAESNFTRPIQLSGAPKGASVLVLGAGIAGLVAAYELRSAGYRVQVLEYNGRAGGRNWTLRGGDQIGRAHV